MKNALFIGIAVIGSVLLYMLSGGPATYVVNRYPQTLEYIYPLYWPTREFLPSEIYWATLGPYEMWWANRVWK